MALDRSSLVRRGLVVAWLFLVWLLLWGSVRVDVLLSGVLVAVAAVWASALPPVPLRSRIRWTRVPGLTWRFLVDLVGSSVDVAVATFRRGRSVRSSVFALPLPDDVTDTALLAACNRISLVPGSLVVEIDRVHGRLFLYQLDTDDRADVERARARAQRVLDDALATVVPRGRSRDGGDR